MHPSSPTDGRDQERSSYGPGVPTEAGLVAALGVPAAFGVFAAEGVPAALGVLGAEGVAAALGVVAALGVPAALGVDPALGVEPADDEPLPDGESDGVGGPPGVGVSFVTSPTRNAQVVLIVVGLGWFSIDTTAPVAMKLTCALAVRFAPPGTCPAETASWSCGFRIHRT